MIVCKFCGTELVCSDREEHGGPKPYCPKCDKLGYNIVAYSNQKIYI